MKKILVSLLCICQLISFAQDTVKTDAKLIAATVYYGYGAELTHDARIAIRPGVKQIVINQLSSSMDVNSLQVSVPANVTLLSQQYSLYTPTVISDINPQLKTLRDSLGLINAAIRRNSNLTGTEESTLDKTGKLIEAVINNSGNKTVSSAEALLLLNAYTTKIEKARTNIFNLKENETVLVTRRDAILNQMNDPELQKSKAPVYTGQLTLQVICSSTEEIPVSLSYFTQNAGWTALYDLRVNTKTNELKLIYKASVTQSTGIDWKQTRLTLSTGNPASGGTPPELNPRLLQLYVPAIYSQVNTNVKDMAAEYDDRKMELSEVVITAAGQARRSKAAGTGTKTIDPSMIENHMKLSESQLNTNFEIDLPYDIASDGKLHAVAIKEEKVNALLKNFAIPGIDRDAYLLAQVSDWQDLNLLPGSANIIMDNTYLGKTVIDPNSTADTLNLSLGKDRRIAIKRILVKDFSGTKNNGNNILKTFTYEITIKNNKQTVVEMELKDQFPISSTKEIEVKLTDDGGSSVNSETGILNWQLQLKPGESKKIRFSYSVKYPKDKTVINL